MAPACAGMIINRMKAGEIPAKKATNGMFAHQDFTVLDPCTFSGLNYGYLKSIRAGMKLFTGALVTEM